jgi:hypothetical protein
MLGDADDRDRAEQRHAAVGDRAAAAQQLLKAT